MEVSIENTGELGRKLTVQIPEDQISPKVQSRLQSLSKTTKVQGFRPGKVPMKVIQGRFGAQVREEIIGQLVQSSFQETVTKENIRPAGMPTIDPLEDKAPEGFEYTATFEVMPEINVNPIEKLNVEQPESEVGDADVDKLIEVLRKQNSELNEVDRKSKQGDTLVIDFVGKMDGEAFDGGTAQDFKIELGSGQLIAGFEDGLVGLSKGDEKDLDLTFPEDYQAENLAGKDVVFSVTVKEVQEAKLPELDDEFFKRFAITEGGLEAFKNMLKNNMERELSQKIKEMSRDNILDVLYEANSINLPQVLVDNEAQRLLDEMKENMKRQGFPADALDKADKSTYEEQAKKRVTLQLLLSEIIKENELKADPAKVRQIIETQAQSYDDPSQVINWYYADKSRLAEVEAVALEEDIVNWVLDKADVSKKKMAFDEIMNNRQTG